jgi:circadian clock protein KaiC
VRSIKRFLQERTSVTKSANGKNGVPPQLKKSPTGIEGLDEVTGGGLPTGRPTIVCGGPGCGKTMLGIEFLIRGATQFDEPGVFMAFEETPEDLAQNVASLGFDLKDLAARKKMFLDYVHVERSEIQETGEYDLEGLFIRLQHAIDSVGAKRVVLDTLEALFSGFSNQGVLRAELRRLFRWLKDRDMTTVMTAERGDGALTRYGLEEYVSDCVIVLDHRVAGQLSTRRLRIVKYRGSVHGTNEYPFLIDEHGISVLPITSFGLNHRASTQRISSGIPDLDDLLEGRGYYRGSTVLVSGTAASGKTSIASHFVEAACKRQERALYLSFEESVTQLTRNMRSIGVDLEPWVKKGLLQFHGVRPTEHGLEMHLARLHKMVDQFKPRVAIVDPITSLISGDGDREIQSMLMRLIDFLKANQITAVFTSLTVSGKHAEQSEVGISSLIDTWIVLRELEENGERNRGLYVVKSRGMAHSNQIRQFLLTDQGAKLAPASGDSTDAVTGSAAGRNRPGRTIGQKKQKRRRRQRSAVARIRSTAGANQEKPFLAKAAGENR